MANDEADESMKVVRDGEIEHPCDPLQSVPPHVYDQIIEACRPFYAFREPIETASLPGSTSLQVNHLQLPPRFEDSVAQHQRQKATAKRRIVSPSPEVRQRRAGSLSGL